MPGKASISSREVGGHLKWRDAIPESIFFFHFMLSLSRLLIHSAQSLEQIILYPAPAIHQTEGPVVCLSIP